MQHQRDLVRRYRDRCFTRVGERLQFFIETLHYVEREKVILIDVATYDRLSKSMMGQR